MFVFALFNQGIFAAARATTLFTISPFVTYESNPTPSYQFHYQETEVGRLFSSTAPHPWAALEDLSILTRT